MSHIGIKKIILPQNTFFSIKNNIITITGLYGTLNQKILPNLIINQNNLTLVIERTNNTKTACANHGLMRTLIQNMIIGVTTKFTKILLLEGVGFKFQKTNNLLTLILGFSHIINIPIPLNIEINIESFTKLIISGINKELVGTFAAYIRSYKKPEPYKGKGILYNNEKIIKKIGKKGK